MKTESYRVEMRIIIPVEATSIKEAIDYAKTQHKGSAINICKPDGDWVDVIGLCDYCNEYILDDACCFGEDSLFHIECAEKLQKEAE